MLSCRRSLTAAMSSAVFNSGTGLSLSLSLIECQQSRVIYHCSLLYIPRPRILYIPLVATNLIYVLSLLHYLLPYVSVLSINEAVASLNLKILPQINKYFPKIKPPRLNVKIVCLLQNRI